MRDLNRLNRKINNDTIVNRDIVKHPDRNIENIIINCYANLNQTKLAGYSLTFADLSTEFRCEYKAQLDKLKAKYKAKLDDVQQTEQDEYYRKLLNIDGNEESLNILSIKNNFKILKLKYYIDPVGLIDDKYILHLVEATLNAYNLAISGYTNVSNDSREYLLYLKDKYTKLHNSGTVIAQRLPLDKRGLGAGDLFCREQLVLIPMYNDDSKYVIDGIKYYGVFNNTDAGLVTTAGAYGTKVFKSGKISTTYLYLVDDVLFIKYFGQMHNLFHMLSEYDAKDIDIYDVFPTPNITNDPFVDHVFKKTYEHAKLLEEQSEELYNYKIKATMPDPKKMENGRATFGDKAYVKQLINAAMEYVRLRQNPIESVDRKFSFLSNMEEEVYAEINTRKITKKNLNLDALKKRINLTPMSILKVIKKGSGETDSNVLFASTSVEPNPFDIFYVFGYMKGTQHTKTKDNLKKGSIKMSDEQKWIKWTDSEYLGEFSPKSENNIGRATTLRFGIDSKYITERTPLS